jgi:hypothetical protein
MNLAQKRNWVQGVLQETSREKGDVEASTAPSYDYVTYFQSLEKFD